VESRAGAGLFEHVGHLLCCFTKEPVPRLGDQGAGHASVTERVVCPPFPLSELCPGTIHLVPLLQEFLLIAIPWPQALWGHKRYLLFLNGKLIFCFLPKLPLSQSLGLRVFRHYIIPPTRHHLFPPQLRSNGIRRLPNAGMRLLGLWW